MKDLIMNAKVVFKATESHPEFYIRRISEVEIESSWKMICSTAQVVLPRNIKDFNQNKVKDWFKRGDKVEIYLCYGLDEDLILEFSGYITQVSADYPITIKLEDEMWRLKQIPVNFSSKNEKLKSFVQKYVTDYPILIDAEVPLGAINIKNKTLGEVFKKFQEDLSLYPFIRNGKLVVAKPYSDVTDKIPVFDLEKNCVSNDLNYLSKEERTVKVIAESVQNFAKTKKKLKFELGDPDPKTTINKTLSVTTLNDLQAEVRRIYDLYKKEGFDGSFTTFGTPSVQHGQKVKITSSLYNDREGIYYIDSIKKKFSRDGYRQEIELGPTFVK
ncbi:MAG: hypothetical protein KAY28_05740 [Cloacibacterium sp.]|nr:hypothetical protein [Cloacibacterium sp.]MBP8085628.1 hypothetical protein [Cloacibacterium sp.]